MEFLPEEDKKLNLYWKGLKLFVISEEAMISKLVSYINLI